jgi:hypothetical protein
MNDNTAQGPGIPEESTVPQAPSSAKQEGDKNEILGRLTHIGEQVGPILTAIAGTAAIFYVLGFMIVNLFLSGYGIREFSLANARYLSAGIVFVFYHGLILLVALVLGKSYRGRKGWGQEKTVRHLFLVLLGLLYGLVGIVAYQYLFLAIFTVRVKGPLLWILLRTGGHQLMLLILSFFVFIKGAAAPNLDNEKKAEHWTVKFGAIDPLAYSLFTLVALFMLAYLWARTVYPYIRPGFGGGFPVVVQIIPAESETLEILSNMGIEVQNGATISIGLLEDTEKSLFVLLKNRNAAKLDRELKLNILYLSPGNITPSPSPADTPTATSTSTNSPVIFVTVTPTPP